MKKIILSVVLALAVLITPSILSSTTVYAKFSYGEYVTARTLTSGLTIQPTGIYEPESFSEIPTSANVSTYGYTSIMLTPDSNMNITLGGEKKSFTEVFNNKLKGVYVPVLRLTNKTVDSFISYMNDEYLISDVMVVTSDISVLKKIYEDEVASIANTVYDLTSVTLSEDRYFTWQYIAESNKTYTNVLMFDASDENLAVAAEYLGVMCKVCWAYANNAEEATYAVAAGATGVVTQNTGDFKTAISYFTKSGYAKAQSIAAHRGITTYANENSLTAVSAAVSEGATHAEIDIQLCRDGEILLCHNMSTSGLADKAYNFEPCNSQDIRNDTTLTDYSKKYGETFPTLDEVIDAVYDSNLILIIELKLEDGRTAVVNKGAIEKFLNIMRSHPEMDGRWFCITFYRPYADQMRELAPEISVGFLGGATSGYEKDQGISGWDGEWTAMTRVSEKIAFMHKFETLLDETYDKLTDNTAQTYLARGYVQNGWTFNSTGHLNTKCNIATSNVMEECAMAIKEITPTTLKMTKAQLESGKITVNTVNYCGWQEDRECEIIMVSKTLSEAKVILYYKETVGNTTYGLYSRLLTFEIV